MPKLFKQNQSRLVGIDIRSSAFHLLEFGDNNGQIIIKQGALVPLSIANSRRKITGAAVALCGAAVFCKELRIEPGLSHAEIERAIFSEVKKNGPDLGEECYWDFHPLGALHLQIVACRKEGVDRLIAALGVAKISVEVVEVDYYALQRAVGLLSDQLPLNSHQRTLAVLNIEASNSTFLVFQGENLLFTRVQERDNEILLDRAKQHLGVKDWLRGYAAKAKNHSGLRLELARLMAPGIDQQLSQHLKFYYSSGYDQLDHLILSGECALMPELADCVQEQQQMPIVVANPFANVSFGAEVDAEFLEAVAPAFMLCSGLALRKHPNGFH